MTASSSAPKDNVGALPLLHATVFYDPDLFHYVSSGWDLDELLSGRVRTSSSTFTKIAIPVHPTQGEHKTAVYSLGASQLRREALRSIILSDGFSGEAGNAEGTRKESSGMAESVLEAALDRWMPLTHLYVHGGKRRSAAKIDSCHAATPFVSIVKDEEAATEMDVQCVLSAMQQRQQLQQQASGGRTHYKPTNKGLQFPLLVSTDASSAAAVSLVLSFVKDAHTWRKLRREARLTSASRLDLSPASAAAGNERLSTDAPQQHNASADVSSACFVSDDDVLFTKWLESTRALRRQWRRQWQLRCVQGAVAPASPSAGAGVKKQIQGASTPLSRASRSTSSSSSQGSEKKEDVPRPDESSKGIHNDGGAAHATVDAEARRAAILAALERRRKK